MRYFKIVGEKVAPEGPTEIFETGQLKAVDPVSALKIFVAIFQVPKSRESIERVFAKGGYLVLKENK